MQEQARRLSEPLSWGRGQKLAVAVTLAFMVVTLAVLGIKSLADSTPARADCVTVTFASTLGGSDLHGCGAKARAICASGSFRSVSSELQAACKHAGFAYKPPS